MSGKKRRRSGSYRPPGGAAPSPREAPEPAPRRGLLDTLFAPRTGGPTSMPGGVRSWVRGIVTVFGSPWIVGTGLVLILVIWIGAVLAGFKGPFALLANALSIPPISTLSVDATIPFSVASGSGLSVLAAIFATLAFRAVVYAAFTGAVVDQLEGGAASHWSLLRGLRALPVTLAASLAGFMILTIGQQLAPLLGGLALFALLAAVVLGTYLFAFAPVIALTEDVGVLSAISRSVRAARMPRSGNLAFAALYATASVVLLFAPKPGGLLGVNPSVVAWLVVLVTSLFHLVFQAALAFRYLCVADEVPEPAARPQPAGRGRR